MANQILKYVQVMSCLDEEYAADICDNYDTGEDSTVSEAKEVLITELAEFIGLMEDSIEKAKRMKLDCQKMSKDKFFAKYG